MAKTYAKSAQAGETAIAAVHGLVVDAGHVWHHRGQQDFGIDGEIELVDPVSRAALNKLLLVQVKGRSELHGESDDSFYVACEPDHINYWLNADVPVLLVVVKRATKEAWWKNVTAWFQNPGARRSGRVDFDKARDRLDPEIAGTDWLALGAPSSAPGLRIHTTTERLITNLLPITAHPQRLYFAPTDIKTFPQSRTRLESHGHRNAGRDYLLLDGMVFSFRTLREPPFDVLCSSDVEEDLASEWARGDIEQRYRFKRLIKMQFGREFAKDLRYDRDEDLNYFRALEDLSDRVIKLPHGRKRTVVVNKGAYIRHHAIRIRFLDIDDEWFIAIDPDYKFTTDGYKPHWNAGALKAGIKRLDRHTAVRNNLLFWASWFSSGQLSLLDAGPLERSLRFGPPATTSIDVGYEDRHLPADLTSDDSEADDSLLDLL